MRPRMKRCSRFASVGYNLYMSLQSMGGVANGIRERAEALARYEAKVKNCAHCGARIELIVATGGSLLVGQTLAKKFCNARCSALAHNRLPRRRMQPALKTCSTCLRELRFHARFARCDDCRSGNVRLAPAWLTMTKVAFFAHRRNWQSARSSVQRHARASFVLSGRPKVCAVCGYDRHVEVAHRRAVSEFSSETTIAEINALDNLMALCPNHHWEQEHGGLVVAAAGFEPAFPTV